MGRFEIAKGAQGSITTPEEEYSIFVQSYNMARAGKKVAELSRVRDEFLDRANVLINTHQISKGAYRKILSLFTTSKRDYSGVRLRSGRDVRALLEESDLTSLADMSEVTFSDRVTRPENYI